jgi:beta-lactamase class D
MQLLRILASGALALGLASAAACATATSPEPASPAAPQATPAPAPAAAQPTPAAAQPVTSTTKAAPAPSVIVDEGGAEVFRAASVEGAFVLLDTSRGVTTVINPEIASQGFLPASTFKIPNTLIGLDTGVIPDEHFALKWDGVKRSVTEWNRDHNLTSAMRHSAVWFYQEIARRIGPGRMQKGVSALAYGNRDISGGIDQFWLDGGLRISPREQVDFIRRLEASELPVPPEHRAIVRRLITLEERPGVTLRGKTGLTIQGDRAVGWLVGSVDKGGATFIYATLLLAPERELSRMIPLRHTVARRLLARHGVLPADMAP